MDAEKLEEAQERFFIMDSQSDVNQEYIFSYLARNYGQEISAYIQNKYAKSPAKAPRNDFKGTLEPGTTNNTPRDNQAPINALGDVSADFTTLSKYIEAGIKLIPTKPNEAGNFYQLKKDNELIKIDSLPWLQYWIAHDINRFIFIPKEAGFLCLDIDRNHADGVDGLKNFASWLHINGLENIPMFKDLDGGSFPTYTTTASGGLHLYFKCTADLKTFATIAPGVEIKYNGLNLTAGGSVKNGKPYILHGELNKAPYIPAPLLLRFSKELSKNPPARPKPTAYKYQAKEREYTPEQLLDFARQDAHGGNHEIIFKMAQRLKRAGFPEADTMAIIENTPEHQGREHKEDTRTCVHSVYN